MLAVALTAFAGSMATAIQYDRFETNILNNHTDAVSHSWAYVDAIDPHGQQWKCYAQGVAAWDCFKPKNNSYGVKTSEKHRADERNFWGIPLTSTRFEYGNSWVGGSDAYNNSLAGWVWHKRTSATDNLSDRLDNVENSHVGFFGALRSGLSTVWHGVKVAYGNTLPDELRPEVYCHYSGSCVHDENKRDITDANLKDVDHIRLPTKFAVKGEYHSWYKYHTLNYIDPAGAANSFNLLAAGEWKFWAINQYAVPYLEVMITHANKLNGRTVPNRHVVIVDSWDQQNRTSIQAWEDDNYTDRFYYLNVGLAVPHVCLLYTSPSPRDRQKSRMPSSA